MDLHMSGFSTLIPQGPCFVFYVLKRLNTEV